MLTTDPVDRQGHPGTISHVSYDKEVIEVSFADELKSLYASDALLVLKPHATLFREMMEALRQMEAGLQDFKTLLRISMILENGTPKQQHEAFRNGTLQRAGTPFCHHAPVRKTRADTPAGQGCTLGERVGEMTAYRQYMFWMLPFLGFDIWPLYRTP